MSTKLANKQMTADTHSLAPDNETKVVIEQTCSMHSDGVTVPLVKVDSSNRVAVSSNESNVDNKGNDLKGLKDFESIEALTKSDLVDESDSRSGVLCSNSLVQNQLKYPGSVFKFANEILKIRKRCID
jgi:hypothetical protein